MIVVGDSDCFNHGVDRRSLPVSLRDAFAVGGIEDAEIQALIDSGEIAGDSFDIINDDLFDLDGPFGLGSVPRYSSPEPLDGPVGAGGGSDGNDGIHVCGTASNILSSNYSSGAPSPVGGGWRCNTSISSVGGYFLERGNDSSASSDVLDVPNILHSEYSWVAPSPFGGGWRWMAGDCEGDSEMRDYIPIILLIPTFFLMCLPR